MSRHELEYFMKTRENEGIDLIISPECTESMRTTFLPFSEFENAEECEAEAKEVGEFWTTVTKAQTGGVSEADLIQAFRKRRLWLMRKAVRNGHLKFSRGRGKNQRKK